MGISALVSSGCQKAASEPEKSAARPGAPGFPVAAARQADDAARFLAGLPGREGSPYRDLEDEEVWKAHAAAFDEIFARWRERRQPAMTAFAAAQLASAGQATVFYPFGGPDILHVRTFYPASPVYILVGLEPPGGIPKASEELVERLPRIRQSLADVLGKSFFITGQMDRQVRGQVVDGVLPIMLVELVRNGAAIAGTAPVTVNESGEIIARDPADKAIKNRGVAVDFVPAAGGAARRLYYFSVNLADAGLGSNAAFRAFLGREKDMVAMFKSTSYMPHRKEFSVIRQEVLDHARLVVQDDSGIPYHFYDPARWTVDLFGDYEHPYGSFRHLEQKDLRAAYVERKQPLGFPIGYGFGRAPSNLQVARRK